MCGTVPGGGGGAAAGVFDELLPELEPLLPPQSSCTNANKNMRKNGVIANGMRLRIVIVWTMLLSKDSAG